MTALYIILAVVAVIILLLLIPADCILEFSYNNKENNGSVIIKYAFLKFKIFPNDKVEEEVENEEETTDKEEKQEKSDILGIITLIKEVYKQFVLSLQYMSISKHALLKSASSDTSHFSSFIRLSIQPTALYTPALTAPVAIPVYIGFPIPNFDDTFSSFILIA